MTFKRIFDITASIFGLSLLSPILLAIALLIRLKMPGPVFFTQDRVGKDAKLFRMVKFRTMIVGHNGNSISVRGESRITPLGAFLRKYKLDELPELWNVLIGDMSFVGPRPDVPGYADQLEGADRAILSIRPGITGVSTLIFNNEEELLSRQADPVKFNDEVLYPEKVRLNVEYLKHRTFLLDIKIILFTFLGKKLKEDWAQSKI